MLERLKDHFWVRWSKKYLLEQRSSDRLKMKDTKGQTVAVGDIVMLLFMKMGCIEDFGGLAE